MWYFIMYYVYNNFIVIIPNKLRSLRPCFIKQSDGRKNYAGIW